MSTTEIHPANMRKEAEPEESPPIQRINGTVSRILQFGQLVVLGAVLPWGVWVTGQIYALNSSVAQQEQWRQTREKAAVATMTDVELAKFKVKDELLAVVSLKIDDLSRIVNDIDKRLREHDAMTRSKVP